MRALTVISPRGMLEPWALSHKKYKKKVAWLFYQRRNLIAARVLHATSNDEAMNLRQLGLRNKIAVIPNGVDIPVLSQPIKGNKALTTRRLLFLSRLHPKKGLLNLIEATKVALPTSWELIIAGPDEGNHRQEVEALVKQLQLEKQVHFVGPIDNEEKWNIYENSDLFVLPSFSENFGIVIAEALAAGVPVITTKATPWGELQTHNCGWWIDIGVEPLADAIRHATRIPDQERRLMGQNGRKLIQEKYSWSDIANKMFSVYEWVLNGGPRPNCLFE